MSADNGVYVLHTKGPEYRVTYANAIDNIYGDFNDDTEHWDGDPEMIREFFNISPVFDNLDDAMDFAEQEAIQHEYLEDGICVINDFRELNYQDL